MEGYVATSDERFLREAVRWAKAGLPFVYFWGLEGVPVMKGSTIPIFGASFYTLPWFGRPVQWNGLVYAFHLLRLARYDRSFPWDKVALNILSSALRQQVKEGTYRGLYPDSWDLGSNSPNPPYINLSLIHI